VQEHVTTFVELATHVTCSLRPCGLPYGSATGPSDKAHPIGGQSPGPCSANMSSASWTQARWIFCLPLSFRLDLHQNDASLVRSPDIGRELSGQLRKFGGTGLHQVT
jgi:hypothetical protein